MVRFKSKKKTLQFEDANSVIPPNMLFFTGLKLNFSICLLWLDVDIYSRHLINLHTKVQKIKSTDQFELWRGPNLKKKIF